MEEKCNNISKIPERKFFIRRLEQIRIPGDDENNIKTKADKCYEEKCKSSLYIYSLFQSHQQHCHFLFLCKNHARFHLN